MLRVLALAEFDPAGVVLSHRDCLCLLGIDFRVALHTAWTPRHGAADWVYQRVAAVGAQQVPAFVREPRPAPGDLMEFAQTADVIQIHPSIGQPWADSPKAFGPTFNLDPPEVGYFDLDWREIIAKAPRRVAYFHGSINAWAHRGAYAKHYLDRGYDLATSTLDYAVELPGAYLPPILDVPETLAALRGDTDPFVISHTPTNPDNCHTETLKAVARSLGIPVRLASGRPHLEILALKRRSHACFDHLRGSFSVNSLEACALGVIPLVGFHAQYRERLAAEGIAAPPWPFIINEHDLQQQMALLQKDPALTREKQAASRLWFEREFTTSALQARLLKFYS